MNQKASLIFALPLAFLILSSTVFASAENRSPAWLRQAAATQLPIYKKDVPAAVLHNEQQITLSSGGKLVTTEKYAVKILSPEGREFAVATAFYLASFGKVSEMNGWVIRPDGSVKEYDKKSILDVISDPDDVYNEGRVKVIDASKDIDTGYIFGYTIVSEDQPLFYQDNWSFQERLPTILARYSLNLPAGWKASSITFNREALAPQISGTNYTWELRNLAPIAPEPLSPSVRNIAPRIAVNYAPEAGAQVSDRAFADWTEVSRWATRLYDPQVIIDDAIAGKARELTANSKTELEKIRAIGTYVQNLQYISIDIGVGYGNGYRPRPSTTVMNRGYGDCKDKANLMRAMLKTLKIEAYPIAIYSGDPTFVREEWASPVQFNHCIIAVKISDGTNAATVINHSKLGRLLVFDATDPYTPVGDLPDYLQGSKALIIAGDNGGLSSMPITPPETDFLERNVEVSLTAEGEIKGKIRERAGGQTSTIFRRELRALSAPAYRQAIEGWLTSGATGAQLIKVDVNDKHSEAIFDLDVEFAAARYAQLMQNRLLVFKPAIVGRRNGIFLTEQKRDQPVLLDSSLVKENAVFTLPRGFAVDEIPDAVTLETPFGKYTTKYEVKDGKLIFARSLLINRTIVPVNQYQTVKDFYAKILAAENAPVVLLKQ